MNPSAPSSSGGFWDRLKIFFALSRTPHGLIDMAAPALVALLSLGAFPSFGVTLLGLVTAFAGYTAVYALNDLVDYRSDREKVRSGNAVSMKSDLDAFTVRHPMAHGLLSLKAGLLWTAGWGVLALVGAWLLNPTCLVIFFAACVLEILYCLLWRVTPYRAVLNGLVKTAGPVAAVFAVNPNPPVFFLVCSFLFIFFWEIGGQNIPNDWTDVEEDRQFKAKTVPIAFGPEKSAHMVLFFLTAAVFLSLVLFIVSPAAIDIPFYVITAAFGGVVLLWPAVRLSKTRDAKAAMRLFNAASYYPAGLLVIAGLSMAV